MHIKKENLSASLDELEAVISKYKLPSWEDLPQLDLYMDQVISLMNGYLEIYTETKVAEKLITSSMINNYVKLGIIPPPVKKRYSKIHLAYLIIVCALKQTLNMTMIKKIIPVGISEQEVCVIYNSFVKNQRKAFLYVTENIKSVAVPILTNEGDNQERLNDLLMQVCSSANIFKILTEKITDLEENE